MLSRRQISKNPTEMLSFEHVSYRYPAAALVAAATSPALIDITFSMESSEHVVLLGSNGSGKSTLAHLTNGLLLPDEGTIKVNGLLTNDRSTIRELRSQIGVLAQNPDNQIVSTTVLDEVAFGPENLGFDREKIIKSATAALEALGLTGFEERDPNTLSGGEKQRLVIAGLIAMNPAFLVLDEPTSMLDHTGRDEVRKVIKSLHAQGHGILHITHDLGFAHEADRLLVLLDGKLVYAGRPDTLLSDENLLVTYGLKVKKSEQGSEARQSQGKRTIVVARQSQGKRTIVARQGQDKGNEARTPLQTGEHESKNRPSPSLGLSDVHYSYDTKANTEREVLQGIDLTITPGSYTLITGDTGSGKTTLLRIIAGLLEPTMGKACFSDGGAILPGSVGIVFQHPESQLFARTVAEEITFGPDNLGLVSSVETKEKIIEEALYAVGLDPQAFSQRSPFTLSGGEMRRVAIASILAMQPAYLLLDEPTAGLDALGKAFVYDLIEQLVEAATGLVVVSHDIEEFESLAQTCFKLKDGTLWHL